MLQVALEGITWALALPRRPLQAPWKDESDQTPRSGWLKVLDLPGLLGVGGWLSQAVLHSVNWPNLLCMLWAEFQTSLLRRTTGKYRNSSPRPTTAA